MLSKKYRLSGKDINWLHKKGRRLNAEPARHASQLAGVAGRGMAIKCLTNRLGHSRFAVNVPVKTAKRATERNRIRRVVYDEIGKNKNCLDNGAFDCLISIYQKDDEEALRAKIKKVCANL